MNLKAIRLAFAAAAGQVPGVDIAVEQEPTFLPQFDNACVTLTLRKAPASLVATGGLAEVRAEFTVYVYVVMRTYEDAQDALEDLLPRLLALTLTDSTLGDTCDEAHLLDDGVPPYPEEDGQSTTLTKELRLLAIGEISG